MAPSLILHSCCAPCSSAVVKKLIDDYQITVLFYNPNIEPKAEYLKRKEEQIRLLSILNVPFIDIDYDNEVFDEKTKEYQNEKENGQRCKICYELRLEKTALIGTQNNFKYFCTTLTISPHKKSDIINYIGNKIAENHPIEYLAFDFKKQGGFEESLELSKKYDLYRQNYCGCRYSKGA